MNRGEIWYVNLDPIIGSEMKKTRRAVIINNDTIGRLPLRVIVPITAWKDEYKDVPWMVQLRPDRLNNLEKASAADAFQVRSVSVQRLEKQAGYLTREIMEQIDEAIAVVISEI